MDLPQLPSPRCIHLQSKTMAIHGEGFENDQDGLTDAWCIRTGRPLGPDDGAVNLAPCSDPDRGCHQEY
jgi:hypothetical protein